MKQICGMLRGRQLQLFGMPMVGFGMVATYFTLQITGDSIRSCEYFLHYKTQLSVQNIIHI
jgi:hypothetical protein